MAINKDAGDTRTYTANQTNNFYLRASANPNALATTSSNSDAHLNWAGRIAGINLPHICVAFYSTTFWSPDAITIQTSNSSGSSFVTVTNGLTLGTTLDHSQVPGFHLAPFSVAGESNGTVYYKIMHATDNSGNQSLSKA